MCNSFLLDFILLRVSFYTAEDGISYCWGWHFILLRMTFYTAEDCISYCLGWHFILLRMAFHTAEDGILYCWGWHFILLRMAFYTHMWKTLAWSHLTKKGYVWAILTTSHFINDMWIWGSSITMQQLYNDYPCIFFSVFSRLEGFFFIKKIYLVYWFTYLTKTYFVRCVLL
jgi:hypothetical protein